MVQSIITKSTQLISEGTNYGDVISFTTPAITAPTVNTTSESNITFTSATINGNVASDGGVTITERGFVYSTSNTNPEIDGANVIKEIVGGTETGDFSKDITGLTDDAIYYYKAYATNSKGTNYGAVISFKTLAIAPIIFGVASAGETITMQISESVMITDNVDNEDFTVTSSLNGVTTIHTVTNIVSGSIMLTVTPAIPSGAIVLISYDPTQGDNTDAITDNDGNPLPSFTDIRIYSDTASNEDFKLIGIISPNPTAGFLNITVVEKANYRLLNIRGQVLKKGILDAGKRNKLDISSFAKGIYFLNLKTSKGNFIKKVVKN